MNNVLMWAQVHPLPTSIVGVLLVVVAVGLARSGRRTAGRPPAAVVVASLAAMACTAYSGDTSWGFAEHRLHMTSTAERGAMFAAAELALFSCALMARQNLNTQGAPGTPGVLVWFITGVQVIPAYSESGVVGGTVRAVVGPVLAALLWHLAMGIELRHAKPGADSHSLPAVIAREVRERLLSRLGLATRDRTAEQITRDRATTRAVRLASRPNLRRWGRGRLAAAVARSGVATDPEQREKLLQLLAARRNAMVLATVDLPSPWSIEVERVPVEPEAYPALPEPVPAVPEAVPAGVKLLPIVARPKPKTYRLDSFKEQWVPSETPVVLAAEEPRTRVEVRVGDVPDWTVDGTYADAENSQPEPDEEPVYPDPLIPQVRADFPNEVPGVRRLKETYSIGQPRAQRIRDELTGVSS